MTFQVVIIVAGSWCYSEVNHELSNILTGSDAESEALAKKRVQSRKAVCSAGRLCETLSVLSGQAMSVLSREAFPSLSVPSSKALAKCEAVRAQ